MRANGDNFGRSLASLAVMVGLAVGLGNVWRFPYMMGRYGGGAFLLLYLVALLLIGVPALAAELALGRATGSGPPDAYRVAGLPGGMLAGGLLFVTVLMATSYYVVVVGWVVRYMGLALLGDIQEVGGTALFTQVRSDLPSQMVVTGLVLAACGVVLAAGVRRGISRVSRLFVPIFFVLLLALVVRSVTLPGAGAGVRYLLTFDPGLVTGRTALAVVGQAAFSLGLGGTFLVIYGSYVASDIRLFPLAVQTAAGDLSASLLAAFLVIPATFVAGLEPASGPPLLFETLPTVFAGMPAGSLLAALFFLALGMVAFLSTVGALEVLIPPVLARTGWGRTRVVWAVVAVELLLAVPSMISLDYLTRSDLIWGSTMQPVGSLVALFTVGWVVERSRALEAAGLAERSRAARLWLVWLRFVVPGIILLAVLSGWLGGD